jgi:leader peptidase (prepilin peptidase)/N-methyltransferase
MERAVVLVASCGSVAVGVRADAASSMRAGLATGGVLFAAAALVDVVEHRIPNRLLIASVFATVVGLLLAGDARAALHALAGAAVAGGCLLVVWLSREVGMGDVKMAGAVGLSAGGVELVAAPLAIFVAALLAALIGVASGRRRLPLAPAMWCGWMVAIVIAPLVSPWPGAS